jgi:ABC-type branched-chain amino acid transport systems, periplasmic component
MPLKWTILNTLVAASLVSGATVGAAAEGKSEAILVGNLVDFSGPTASVGTPYGRGKIDAVAWINRNGGIRGRQIDLDTFDAGYQVPPTIAEYQIWHDRGVTAIQGWGTADTEALVRFVGEDHVPFFSGSYSAGLTDPTGKNAATRHSSPYNFIMGPSYSDGVRALLDWAKLDWRQRASDDRAPRYVHMGDNHPYPNSPRKAGESYAEELGFTVLPAVQYSMAPGDFRQQCLTLKESGADYAYLGNTAASNIDLIRTCRQMGVTAQFLSNIWGFDERAMQQAGTAADGLVWVMASGTWSEDTPGMARVRAIAKAAEPSVGYQPHHYVRGVCSVFFMKEAMEWAADHGELTGPAIKEGMYQKADWVPDGLEGACARATWTADDHRGFSRVSLYRAHVASTPDAKADLGTLISDGTLRLENVYSVDVPRRPDWLGW